MPVRTDEHFRAFNSLGGGCVATARREMGYLTGRQLGDLFLVKSGTGSILTWARILDAGGRGVNVTHGLCDEPLAVLLEKFAVDKHESKRLFAPSWEDEGGKTHLDLARVDAKLRIVAGLPLPAAARPSMEFGKGLDGGGAGNRRARAMQVQ